MKSAHHSLVRMGLLKKKADLDMEVFRRHWYGIHADLAGRLAGLRAYIQNRVVDHRQRGTDLPRGREEYDGFSQLWFDSIEAMRAAVAGLGQSLSADEVRFLGDLRIVILHQYEVMARARNSPAVKQLSLLRRRPEISVEKFAAEWRGAHARLVAAMPGVRGYLQGLIIERESPKNNPVGYEGLPLDGVSEIWFDSIDGLGAAFASAEGKRAAADAARFIAEATTFIVEERVVV
jgi:uncharacterized protein (TIGR02118 family)